MQVLASRSMFGTTLTSWRYSNRNIYQSLPRASNSAAAVERQDRVKIENENAFNTPTSSLTQPHRLTSSETAAAAVTPSSSNLPLLDSLSPKANVTTADLPATRIADQVIVDRSPLPFEDVPGPGFLKLWEKYWKYVPLIGTQLFRSLLINRLTDGTTTRLNHRHLGNIAFNICRSQWNKNVTPLRYLFNTYGPVVRIHGPLNADVILIHRPEHVAKVFEEEGDSPVRSSFDVLQHYRLNYRKYRFAGPFTAQGLQGVEWLQTKKSLEVPITEQMDKQFGKLEMSCDELILRIRQIRNRQDEVPNNFHTELTRWGMECFWAMMLNRKMGFLDATSYNESSESTRFIEALNEAHLFLSRCETGFQVWRFFDTPFAKRLFSNCDIMDGIIGKYIRFAQNSGRDDSTISNKLTNEQENTSSILETLLVKQHMSPDDVSTMMLDMILLGVQATASSQAFLLYYLAKNPRVQKTLFDEISTELKKNPVLSKKSFDNMPYLNACIKECLRLRPPFPYLTRQLPKSITLHGYKIPKGTYVIMANQISSQKEENFEDSDKFKPERWLKSDDLCQTNSYLPFGKGLRSCLGESMAKLQMKILTAKIVQEFNIEYDYADINSSFLIVNVPNRPLRFRFVDRDF